jgi:hypothetical protein
MIFPPGKFRVRRSGGMLLRLSASSGRQTPIPLEIAIPFPTFKAGGLPALLGLSQTILLLQFLFR